MSTVEILAVLFSVSYVILATKENIWCWLCAAVSVTLYLYICFTAKLYPETGLQIFYLIMAFYGFSQWKKPKNTIPLQQWDIKTHTFILLLGGFASFLLGYYFDTKTDAALPYLDSTTTIFSIITTYMVTKKIVENWLYWIAIDALSIYLYYNRELSLTAGLFGFYIIIAVFGYFNWKKSMQNQ
jgi:nicotinamide mononucleotide transporter